MTTQREWWKGEAATWLLALAVLGSALAVGAVDTPVLLLTSVVLLVAVAAAWWGREPILVRSSATTVLVVGLGLTAFTLLQCVPMPRGAVEVLSPHAADIWARALRPFGEDGPRSITLSLDPSATRIEVLRGVVYLLTFVASLRLAQRREGVRRLEGVLLAAGVLITLVSAAHLAISADKLYGFYKPHTGVGTIAPMFNANHLSAYINVALLIAFASVLSPEPLAPRPILIAFIALLASAEFWIASRGGIGAMAIGMAILIALSLRERKRSGLAMVAVAGVCVLVAAFAVFASSPVAVANLTDTDVSKVATAGRVLRHMALAYPFFGVGRGAFESTFPEFRVEKGFLLWTHPENILAQWASEWGLVVSVAALLALAWALRPRTAFARSTNVAGAWVVLLGLLVHNLVDFNSEIPAVGIAGSVCAAIVTAGSSSKTASRVPRWTRRPRWLVLVALAVTALAIVLVLRRPGELMADRERAYAAAQPGVTSDPAFDALLRETMLAHPAEPYFPYLGAARRIDAPTSSIVPWIARTLERAPVYPFAHLALARNLRRRNASQARLEYRLYAEQSAWPVLDVKEVEPLIRSFEDAMELTPPGPDGVAFLDQVADRIAARMPSTRARIDEALVLRDPGAVGPILREARDAQLDAADAPWCEDERAPCVRQAIEKATRAERVAPTRCEGYLLHARALLVGGGQRGAFDILTGAQNVVQDRSECGQRLVELAIEVGAPDEATAAIDALARLPCEGEVVCSSNLVLASVLEERRGNMGRAYVFLKRAHEAEPEDVELAVRTANHASLAGLHGDALAIYSELAKQHPEDSKYQTLASVERSRIHMVAP